MMSADGRRFPAEPLDRAEVEAILDAPSRRAPTGGRNRALLALLHRTGLRIGEALDLEVGDYDRGRGSVTVRRGKGGKPRVAGGIDDRARAELECWLAARPPGARHLFCTLAGGRLGEGYARAMVKRAARRAGVERRVHPHAFRHTLARELVEEGFDLALIRDQLGHASIATTDHYVAAVAPSRRLEALRSRRRAA